MRDLANRRKLRSMGYRVMDTPEPDAPAERDYVVEYDEEALRRSDEIGA